MDDIINYLEHYWEYILYVIGGYFLLRFIFNFGIKEYHSHWNHLLDDFKFSTEEFYTLLKRKLEDNLISNAHIESINLKEGGTFSSRRKYLRIEWKDYQFDFCSAPFGKGFFVSWWLLHKNPIMKLIIGRMPFIGKWLVKKWYPITYYKIDTASMFMTYCQSAIQQVIKDITLEKGMRVLTENERKPILNNIFKR